MSATYQVTSLTTLETSTAPLDKLSRNLKLNSIVSCDGRPMGLVTHWDLVFFSRTWAGWALEEWGEKPPEEVFVTLSLVDQWLQDPHSVSGEELKAAARAAGAARVAARAAEAAEAAAEVAEAARAAAWAAAGAAAEAAEAAAEAAEAAAEAAEAAAEAAEAARAAAWAAAVAAAWAAAGAAVVAADVAAAQAADRADLAARDAAWAAAYQKQGKFIIEHLKNSSQTSFPSSAA